MSPFAWVLNLDAEDELARPSTATPSRSLGLRVSRLLPALRGLVGPDDLVLDELSVRPGQAAGYTGRAWCPTPRALGALRRAGARVPEAPSLAVLQAVNHRGFAAALGQHLPGAAWVTSRAALEALWGERGEESPWLLKRPFGYNGRGRLRVRPGRIALREWAWIDASFARGAGLQCEPEVERVCDLGWHGEIDGAGRCHLGQPTVQRSDAFGQWAGSDPMPTGVLDAGQAGRFRAVVEAAGEALGRAGYFGPFGVDGYLWRAAEGVVLQPLSEINARYSMGWAVGWGSLRRGSVDGAGGSRPG